MAATTPLRANRDFMLLWRGEALSELGSQVAQVAYPLLVLALTGSSAEAGIAGVARTVPFALFALPSGVLIDRVNRRHLMIACDAGRAAALASLALTAALGACSFGQVVAVAFVDGALFICSYGAERALLSRIVETDMLGVAVARNEARLFAANIVGPSLGGFLFGLARAVPFAFDAVSYAASTASVLALRPDTGHPPRRAAETGLRLPTAEIGLQPPAESGLQLPTAETGLQPPAETGLQLPTAEIGLQTPAETGLQLPTAEIGLQTPAETGQHPSTDSRHASEDGQRPAAGATSQRQLRRLPSAPALAEAAEGLRWLWRRPFFRTCSLLFAVGNPVYTALALLVVLLGHRHGASPALIGAMVTIIGLGGLTGALLAGVLEPRVIAHPRRVVLVEVWILAAGMPLLLIAPGTPFTAVVVGLVELATPITNAVVVGQRVARAPDYLQGRVQTSSTLMSMSLVWLGPLAIGLVVGSAGQTAAILVLIGWTLFAAIAATVSRGLRVGP